MTLATLGSGLNLAWRMRARYKDRDRAFWERPISGHVNWIDLYARYDPVPQGEPPAEMVEALTLAKLEDQPWLGVRLANDDWPFTDHFSYWGNNEEVNARLVHVIVDSRLGHESIAALGGSYNEVDPDPLRLEDSVHRAIQDRAAGHRPAVTLRSSARLAAGLVLVAVLIAFHRGVAQLGALILRATGWSWPHKGLTALVNALRPGFLDWMGLPTFQHWLLGAAIIIYAAIILLLLGSLGLQIISWFQTDLDDPWPPPPRTHSPLN